MVFKISLTSALNTLPLATGLATLLLAVYAGVRSLKMYFLPRTKVYIQGMAHHVVYKGNTDDTANNAFGL